MRDDELLQVAEDWSLWERPPPPSVRRAVGLPKSLSNRTALVIQGVRRCGKSTLLTQLIEGYRLDRRDCLFVNFEDPRLAGSLGFETLERLTRAFGERRPGAQTLTVLLDEIQWVDGWEKWLRTRLERPGRFQFVVSGSNSRLLSGELSSALTGRHVTVELKKRFGDVFYWRMSGEVDFVVQSGNAPTPIQVTVEDPTERHLRSLDVFYEAFPHANEAAIVTMGNFPDVLASLDA